VDSVANAIVITTIVLGFSWSVGRLLISEPIFLFDLTSMSTILFTHSIDALHSRVKLNVD
jgi:hypothetical protein